MTSRRVLIAGARHAGAARELLACQFPHAVVVGHENSVGRAMGENADGDDARAAQRVVRQWLAKKGITAPHLVMENGSGLSRAERVSAREMANMLQAAWHSPYAAEYISSLPIAGTDGTMRKRLKTTALRGEAHVKTGTLNTVRAIAGYSRDNHGNTRAVVAILNASRAPVTPGRGERKWRKWRKRRMTSGAGCAWSPREANPPGQTPAR